MRRQVLRLLAIALAVHAGVSAAAAPLCHRSSAAAPALARLREALAHGRFVAYQPTALKVVDGRFSNADPASIRADLEVLRAHFDSLVTYDAVHGAQDIAPIAAALKFRALIIGVWEPADAAQVGAALRGRPQVPAARGGRLPRQRGAVRQARRHPTASGRDRPGARAGAAAAADHQRAVSPLRGSLRATRSSASSTSCWSMCIRYSSPGSAAPRRRPPRSSWSTSQSSWRRITAARYWSRRPGSRRRRPSGGYSSARQASFYKELRQRLPPGPMRAFTYFAAFDAPWREQDATGVPGPHPEESHWGLFDAERRSKPAAEQLPPLPPPR